MKGFLIRKRVARFLHRLLRLRGRRRCRYACIDHHHADDGHSGPPSILSWMRSKTAGFLHRRPGSGYVRLRHRGDKPVRVEVPKGHLAVYVGQKEDDFCRVVVPIIYFNHPLFGRLLTEAEEKFGFHHPGRITIPCPVSEFESVTTRIEASRFR